jgi:hypothetical protein
MRILLVEDVMPFTGFLGAAYPPGNHDRYRYGRPDQSHKLYREVSMV